MKILCPICDEKGGKLLQATKLEERLVGYHCKGCGGYWICSRDYHGWLESKGEILEEKDGYDMDLRSEDTLKAKLCPECSRIMNKYKVGHGLPFKIDLCGNCNGFWLDKNEWEILKSRNLHDEINKIFTCNWQKDVRDEESRERLQQMLKERLGRESLEKTEAFKQWLNDQNEKSIILSYLKN